MRLNLVNYILFITILSCNSEDNNNIGNSTSTDKKLETITLTYTDTNNTIQNKFIYDSNNNLIETRNEKNQLVNSYTWDDNNRLTSHEFNEYSSDELFFKEIEFITYDDFSRISNIEHRSSSHSSEDGVNELTPSNHKISYEGDKIIKTFDGGSTNIVEYLMDGELIKEVKLYNNDELSADLSFEYDTNGNCISGSGPILIGFESELTSNIDLSVAYSSETKIKEFRRPFLNYELYKIESFNSLRQILTNQIGKNFPSEISWNSSENNKRNITIEYIFDEDNFVTQTKTSDLPDYPNSIITANYIWK